MKLKALDKLGGAFAVIMAIGYFIGGSGLAVILGVPLFVIYLVLSYQQDKAEEETNKK